MKFLFKSNKRLHASFVVLILLSFFLLVPGNIWSQQVGDNPSASNVNYNDFFVKNIEEPNASTFKEVKLSAANPYVGSANISIPLYVIKEGNISVPITLSYLSTGVKANSVASNVGLNWTLDAGGVINKVIEGFEDFNVEFSNPIRSIFPDGTDGDCNMNPIVINCGSERKLRYDDFERPADFVNVSGSGSIGIKSLGWFLGNEPLGVKEFLDYQSSHPEKTLSTEELNHFKIKQDVYPDFFFVNAPGLSTQFTHRKDKTPFEIENSGNKIITTVGKSNVINFKSEFINDQLHNHIQNFYGSKPRRLTCINNIEVTNTSGTKYTFGELDVNQHVTRGSEIGLLSYHKAHLSSQEVSAYHLSTITDATGNNVTFEYEKYSLQNFIPSKSQNYIIKRDENFQPTSEPILTEVYYPQLNRLTKINFSSGSVEFKYDLNRRDQPSDKALTEVIVKDKNGKIIKGFRLKYEYFSSNTNCNQPYCLRLKLKSIQEVNKENESLPPYLFFYDETKLPEIGSLNVDYLGYANGVKSSYDNDRHPTTFIVSPSIYYSYGKGRFSFSPVKIFNDSYLLATNGRSLAPSLKYTSAGTLNRMKEPTGAERFYTYELNTFSTPTVKNVTAAGLRLKKQLIKGEKGEIKSLETYTYEDENGNSSGVLNNLPLYGDVKVTKDYRDNARNYNIRNGIRDGKLFFRTYSSPKNKLKLVQGNTIGYSRIIIKNGLDNGVLERNYYTTNDYPIEEPKLLRNGSNILNSSDHELIDAYTNGGHFPYYNNNDVLLGKMRLERAFNDNNEFVSQKKFQYHYDLIEEMQQEITIYKSQLVPSSVNEADYEMQFNPKIFSHRNLQHVIEDKTIYPDHDIEQVTHLSYLEQFPFVKESKTIFNTNHSITTRNYYALEINNANVLGNIPLTSNEMESIASLNRKHQINSPIQTENYRNDKLTNIQRTSFETFQNNNTLPGSIASAKDSRHLEKQVEFTAYNAKGNLEEASRTNGSKIRYVWGYHKQYIIAKIEGYQDDFTPTQISLIDNAINLSNLDNDRTVDYTGKEGALRQALDQIKQGFPNALVTTSTYDPLIGVTSITDARGETIYYNYDDYNRLEFIKDHNNYVITQYCYNYKGEKKKCNEGNDDSTPENLIVNVGDFKEYMIPVPANFNLFPYSWPEIEGLSAFNYENESFHPMFYRPRVSPHHPGDFNPHPISELNTSFYTLGYRFDGATGYIKVFRDGYAFSISNLKSLVNIPECSLGTVQNRVAPDCDVIPNPNNAIENLILKWYILVDGEKYPLLKAPEITTVFFVPQCLDNKVGKIVCEIFRKNDPNPSEPYRVVESTEINLSAGFESLDNNGPDNCGRIATGILPNLDYDVFQNN